MRLGWVSINVHDELELRNVRASLTSSVPDSFRTAFQHLIEVAWDLGPESGEDGSPHVPLTQWQLYDGPPFPIITVHPVGCGEKPKGKGNSKPKYPLETAGKAIFPPGMVFYKEIIVLTKYFVDSRKVFLEDLVHSIQSSPLEALSDHPHGSLHVIARSWESQQVRPFKMYESEVRSDESRVQDLHDS